MERFINKLVEISAVIANNKILQTIQRAFMRMLPITMIGGFASLLKGIDIGGYQGFLISTGLYSGLGAIYQFTVGILAIYVVFLVGYSFADMYDMKSAGMSIGLTALLCFLAVTPYTEAADAFSSAALSTEWLGASGMFTALIMAFLVGGIYKFCEVKKIRIKMPDSVPPMIAVQFTSLIPAAICAVFAIAIKMGFAMTSLGSVHQLIYTIVSAPLQAVGANIFGVWVICVVLYAMWFFGIHGGMTVMPIMMLLFTQAQMENLAAYQAGAALPNMVTGGYLSYGSGSFPLVVACLLCCKSEANKSISRLGALPSFMGVDEPMYFGMPMILNPIFFIPWVIITPTLSVFGTYFLQLLGWLPYATGASAGSFVPFFVTNLVSYGISGLFWGTLLFIVDVIVYIPFIKAYDKQKLAEEKKISDEKKSAC